MPTYLEVLIVTLCSGLAGGVVSGIVSETEYKLRLPASGRVIHLGFLGDALVGMVSGLAGVVVVGRLFAMNFASPEASPAISLAGGFGDLQVAALGLIAGFSGIKIISRLSGFLEKQIGELGEKVESVELKERAEFYVTHGDSLREKGKAELAIVLYDNALAIDKYSEEAFLGKAKVFKQRAISAEGDDDRSFMWREAIKLLSESIANHPRGDRSYYNRSCYRCLAGAEKLDILADLRKAIEIAGYYREYAPTDSDFKLLWDDPDFKNAIGRG